MDAVLENVRLLVDANERDAAVELLLSVARERGLDDAFQVLLERAVPESRWRKWPPTLREPGEPIAGAVAVKAEWYPNPHHLTYGLPEVGQVDDALLDIPAGVSVFGPVKDDEAGFCVAGPPLYSFRKQWAENIRSPDGPWMMGYSYEMPRWSIDDAGVLMARQDGRFDARRYWTAECILVRVYRVRGQLCHYRSVRLYQSGGSDD